MCVSSDVAPHGPGHFLIRELRDVSREIEVNQDKTMVAQVRARRACANGASGVGCCACVSVAPRRSWKTHVTAATMRP